MSIVIQPDLESRLRARAEAEGVTVQAYVERLARDDEAAEEELEALAQEVSIPASRSRGLRAIGMTSVA
jgi:hypothetical protein